MNYDHNKKFGLIKFHSGYKNFNLNSPKGYSLKIFNAQTDRGHKISWFDDIGHVREHLNSWISNYMQYNSSE